MTLPVSVLDLSPIGEGGDAARSFANSTDLAQLAERLGFHRYWFAEHHNLQGVASAATSVLMAHVAAHTKTIRIGAGGIMLPNHAPLLIAEQFGTLESLHPGRIDLGLGRAPGGDPITAQALRRTLHGSDQSFPDDVVELIGYFATSTEARPVRAVPGEGLKVPVWILGSSLFGAQMAAHYGLPYAFASHFAPQALEQAVHVYRSTFKPSVHLDAPKVMMACNVFAADTEEDAKYHYTSLQQAFVNLRLGRPGKLPKPVDGLNLPPDYMAALDAALKYSAVGTAQQVQEKLQSFIDHISPDELIISSSIHDHAARRRSLEITAEVREKLTP